MTTEASILQINDSDEPLNGETIHISSNYNTPEKTSDASMQENLADDNEIMPKDKGKNKADEILSGIQVIPLNSVAAESFKTPERFSSQEGSEKVSFNEFGDKRQMWTKEDELLVAKAWLLISEECSTGTQQHNKEFWGRIAAYYNSKNTSGVHRTRPNIKTHWHYMNPRVSAFNETYNQLKSQHVSGEWSEDDFRMAAHKHYYATTRKDFRYEHIWNLVKNEPNWKPTGFVDYTKKKTKLSAISGAYTSLFDTQQVNAINVNDVEAANGHIGQKTQNPSSSQNNEVVEKTQVNDVDVDVEVEGENPTIGQKSKKRKAKEKAKAKAKAASSSRLDDILERHCEQKTAALNNLQKSIDMRNKLKEEKNRLLAEKNKLEAKKIKMEAEKIRIEAEKIKNMEIAYLFMDTRGMSEVGRQLYVNRCQEIREKYSL